MLCRPCPPPGGAAEPAGAPGLPASHRGGLTTTSEAQRTIRMAKLQSRAAINPSYSLGGRFWYIFRLVPVREQLFQSMQGLAPRYPHATHPNPRNPICIFVFSGVWVVVLVWCRLSVSSVSRPCGRWGSRRCAVWTLAAWRCLILHARLGLRRLTVEWSAIHRVPARYLFPTSNGASCALTPRG